MIKFRTFFNFVYPSFSRHHYSSYSATEAGKSRALNLDPNNHPLILRRNCGKDECKSNDCPSLCPGVGKSTVEVLGNMTRNPTYREGHEFVDYTEQGGGGLMIRKGEKKDVTSEKLVDDPVNTSLVKKYSDKVHDYVKEVKE